MSNSGRKSSPPVLPPDINGESTSLPSLESLVLGTAVDGKALSGTSPFPLLPPPPNSASSPVYWHAGIGANVTAYGASCTISCYRPKVEPGDLSHISVALINDDPSHGEQSIQAGWIRSPSGVQGAPDGAYQADPSQLYVYFTTTGAAGEPADNVKGFNIYQEGFVCLEDTFQPGIDFLAGSLVGGAQRSVDLKFQLSGDKWNLRLNGTVIGYFPTRLFTTDQRDLANPPLADVSKTLADHATKVVFYGQVLDSRDGLTSSDMGSSMFPEEGYRRAAFLGKMQYQPKSTVVDPKMADADDSWSRVVDDPERYNCLVSWKSGSTSRTYMYIGGFG
ncbi:hypothetical protein BKA56DRAFT_498108, partial [Ilyonectria sp. MPI-CAGE-AT-0026]